MLRVLLCVVWLIGVGLKPLDASADVRAARLEPTVDGRSWLLSVDLEPPLTPRLEEALQRGVPLAFTLELEILRPRWYWWNERIAQVAALWRVSYHPLTREFRLGRDGASQSFDSLERALAALTQLRGWRVELSQPLVPGDYLGQVRLRVDVSQLPRPFQIDALTNREWNPQVEWIRFPFTQSTPTSAQ